MGKNFLDSARHALYASDMPSLPMILPDWTLIDNLIDDTRSKLETVDHRHDCGNEKECKDPLQHYTIAVKICTIRELLRIAGKI